MTGDIIGKGTTVSPAAAPSAGGIAALQFETGALTRAKGWRDPAPSVGEAIAMMHSELSEAVQSYRTRGMAAWREAEKPEGVAAELADCIIRILDFADLHGIDMQATIAEKMRYNWTRSYRHGGKIL
jgi:NTP pyrophosphatase (non-canonical NTP hydrolase)